MNLIQDITSYKDKYPLKKFDFKGGTFTYRIQKKSDIALILLVGGLGTSDAFFKHFESFALKFTTAVVDYSYDYPTNAELAEAIIEMIKRERLKHVYLVGQSYGGFLAQVITKLYPEHIEGMVLSNTGCLAEEMKAESRKSMLEMVQNMQRIVKLLRFVPMGLVKPSLKKKILLTCMEGSKEEKQYINELMGIVLKQVTNKHEVHMCNLMIDLINHMNMIPGDFERQYGKTLLILSEDDNTFNEDIKGDLITLMNKSKVRTDIGGGHLALLLKIEAYAKAVEDFILGV